MEINIRSFQPGDEAAFYALNASWILKRFSMDARDRTILGDPLGAVIKPGGRIFFICRSQQVVGCCALIPLGDQVWEVAKMAVDKACRGEGLGRQLLSHVIAEARNVGASKLSLKTSSLLQPAIHLYSSMGFALIDEQDSNLCRNARADVFMELVLREQS